MMKCTFMCRQKPNMWSNVNKFPTIPRTSTNETELEKKNERKTFICGVLKFDVII